ncbi:hypothetical protein ACHAXT_013160 [Thalassiosira profunda]
MAAACALAALLAQAAFTMASRGPSHAPWCMRRLHAPIGASQREAACPSPLNSLAVRGGGVFGKRRRGGANEGAPEEVEVDGEEYEYEYYEVDEGFDPQGDGADEGAEYEYYGEEVEDDDHLLSTPISAGRWKGEEYADEDEDYLLATPIKTRATSSTARKAPKASKENKPSRWQMKGRGRSKRKQWRPVSATKSAFVSSYSGGLPSFSLRSSTGRPIYSGVLSSVAAVVSAIARPIGNILSTVTYAVASTFSRWISISFSLVRNTFDFIWYGPVDGVTTTGITSRYGGLSTLLMSSPAMRAASSVIALGLMAVAVKRVLGDTPRVKGRWGSLFGRKEKRAFDIYSLDHEAEIVEEEVLPPSVEDELRFLKSDFDSANPASKDRIASTINKGRFRRRGTRPKSRRGQREFTIKSIRNWWKERPDKQSIAIIEPQHLRNQQRPLNKENKRLQKQLFVAEQERAMLQQQVQRLQNRLQKQDARSVKSQKKWFQKQASKADQLVSKAVEVERNKANEEMRRVRESMEEELEKERIMMRDRMLDETLDGHNDLDFDRPPNPRRLDGVRIVREVDDELDDYVEDQGGKLPFRAL